MRAWLKGGLIGGVVGFLIWLYDYDFLLNMGGPYTPISNYINIIIIGTDAGLGLFGAFFPLLALIIFGFILGALIGWIIGKFRNKE